MKRVLFACYDRYDFSSISPVFPVLIERGLDFGLLNGYRYPPLEQHIKSFRCFTPPVIRDRKTAASDFVRFLSTCVDGSSVQYLCTRMPEELHDMARTFIGWQDHFFNFALSALDSYLPNLVLVPPGEVESGLMRTACIKRGVRFLYLVPPYFEFKSRGYFEPDEDAVMYLVSGEYGKNRLLKKGVSSEQIRVTGSPKYDHLASYCLRAEHNEATRLEKHENAILYATQGLGENITLFDFLIRYVSERDGVHLTVRTHPASDRGEGEDFKPYEERIKASGLHNVTVSNEGKLEAALAQSDVLVTISSLTCLESLILGVPAVSFKSDFFPEELPLRLEDDVLGVRSYKELKDTLNRLLFDLKFRRNWIAKTRSSYKKYISFPREGAAHRIVDQIMNLADHQAGFTSAVEAQSGY